MIEKVNEQGKNKNETNKDSNNIQNSYNQKIIINNSPNNSIIDDENLNNSVDNQNLNIISKEIDNIAQTGKTKLTWNELKPYIIYFYKKNVKNFSENKKNSSDLNLFNSHELHFPFNDKKEIKDEQMDLNNSNENNFLEEKNFNIMGDFNLIEENHLDYEELKINKENINTQADKYENIEKDIVEFITKINLMPFTIQRIAELILEPKKYYSTLLKYNKAFYKLVNIDFD